MANVELERIWKETTSYLGTAPRNLPEGTEKSHEKPQAVSRPGFKLNTS
jgi:hypothetical protein